MTSEEALIEILNTQREYKYFTRKYEALEIAKEALLFRIGRIAKYDYNESTFRCPSCYRTGIEKYIAICPYCGQFLGWE